MNFFKKTKKGFTLVELVVVIAVIAILAAVSVGAYFGVTESANNSRAEQEAKQVYTQLQTKTLVGLELGNSGMSVSLGNNGLTFNGLYDNNVLNQFSSLVFDQGTEIDVYAIDQVADVIEDSAVNARIFFLATSDSSSSAIAKYMGYVPANLSGKYVKYINLSNGEFTKAEDITGTYKENNYEGVLTVETITLNSFDLSAVTGTGYKNLTSSGTSASYLARVNIDDNTTTQNLLQLNKKYGDYRGIYVKESIGAIKYIAVDWANNSSNTNEDVLVVKGSRTLSYSSVSTIPTAEKDIGNITYPNTIISTSDEVFYSRLICDPTNGSVIYLNTVTFYYENNSVVPNVPNDLNLNKDSIVSDNFDEIQLTADINVIWSSSDETIATVSETGLVTKVGNQYGTVVITATSVDNPDLSKTCTITYKEKVNYSAGLVTSADQLEDGDKIVFVATDKNHVLGSQSGDYYSAVELENNIDATLNGSTFAFNNFSGIEILTVKKVESDKDNNLLSNHFAFGKENGNYIASRSNDTKLSESAYADNNGVIYNSVIYSLTMEASAEAKLNTYNYANRYLKYYFGTTNGNSYSRFGSPSSSTSNSHNIYIYELNHTPNTNITSLTITSDKTSGYVGDQILFNVSANPWFASIPTEFTWNSTNSNVGTVNNGVFTALSAGTTEIFATDGEIESNKISITITGAKENGYYIVTEQSEVTTNDKVIIIGETSNLGMTCAKSGYNAKANPITKDGNKILFDDSIDIITIEEGTTNETISLKSKFGYISNAVSVNGTKTYVNNNYIDTKSEATDWILTITDSETTLVPSIYTTYELTTNAGSAVFQNSAISGNFEGIKLAKLYDEYTPEIHECEFNSGKCIYCGVVDASASLLTKYEFSAYTAGTQYKENEEHILDSDVTVITTQCHFTSELRIYSSSTHNGYAIFKFNKNISKFVVNAGNKKDTLNIFVSNDGSNWGEKPITKIDITSTTYLDYEIAFEGLENYKFFKIDVAGEEQVRLKSFSVIYIN